MLLDVDFWSSGISFSRYPNAKLQLQRQKKTFELYDYQPFSNGLYHKTQRSQSIQLMKSEPLSPSFHEVYKLNLSQSCVALSARSL